MNMQLQTQTGKEATDNQNVNPLPAPAEEVNQILQEDPTGRNRKMKSACIALAVITMVSLLAVCVMVKFATDIKVDERKREQLSSGVFFRHSKAVGLVSLDENVSYAASDTYPSVAAITRITAANWSFSCFGSLILVDWIVTAAHCQTPGATHRALIFNAFVNNYTHTYPILFWKIHDNYHTDWSKQFDIALAKLNVDVDKYTLLPSRFDGSAVTVIQSVVWKTVATMDMKMYLTNVFEIFDVEISDSKNCIDAFKVPMDQSLICVDLTMHKDCFIQEFGPIYGSDKVVGILNIKPKNCDVRYAIFTNVSHHAPWISRSTASLA